MRKRRLAHRTQRVDAGARLKAALAVNSELILLYWQIGHDILRRQRDEGWGAKVIDRLAADLRHAFPEMTGLSARNLKDVVVCRRTQRRASSAAL